MVKKSFKLNEFEDYIYLVIKGEIVTTINRPCGAEFFYNKNQIFFNTENIIDAIYTNGYILLDTGGVVNGARIDYNPGEGTFVYSICNGGVYTELNNLSKDEIKEFVSLFGYSD